MMRALFAFLAMSVWLAGCGVAYKSPAVSRNAGPDGKVRVVSITPETVLVANRSTYSPKRLPEVFFQTAGSGSGLRGAGAVPQPAQSSRPQEGTLETRLPPPVSPQPYRIGIGDVVLLATQQAGSTVEELTGLLAATNARQGYTVQDDGAIAIPNVGRVNVSGLTLEEAEAEVFQRLVENQIDPTFSLEIAEFNSKKISIGGAVAQPTVAPIRLTPIYLDEALAAAGGITVEDEDLASVRIYRDGTLYQIPLEELYSNSALRRIQLVDGDSVFVDTSYELELARAYFEEQIRLAEFRQDARVSALNALNTEVAIRRNNQQDARQNFQSRLELGSVERDYVYLTGEVGEQSRYPLPFDTQASLADALYEGSGGVTTETGDVSEIYVLRGSPDPREFGAMTAWRLNAKNANNLVLATRFQLRPNDVIFVAEQPVTRWNRVIRQITPSLITTSVAQATN
ncbi:polysaccharide biosynthesis/export family protein [Roseivivax sediminis]|uniref:Polysaccharide export outer membrane protein n=1 Tax=Roseivivax sediminis TaxID=936889 RepID=A0A1I2CXP1_9RHOB|nr:polysaccharide biosynthesis/export family protein [Roseivivax sediminis]SFE72500.1 polysaccharide export outer membrane protein [Roseivivax sediminis]